MTLAVNIAQGGSNNVTFRNRIINGAMVVSQYNGTSVVTPSATATNVYVIDRFFYFQSQASKFNLQQLSASPPTGFNNYLGATVASSVSIGVNDYFGIGQIIEGFNSADLGWGSANAKTVTLSFQVYSSLTGTFGGAIQNAAQNRSYPFSYTISSANTWTSISVTITGDTGGTWVGASNSGSVRVNFSMGMGSSFSGTAGSWSANNYMSTTSAVSVVGTGSATFYITGVQLEAGTTASPFEYRQYGTEENLCLRYYEVLIGSGYYANSFAVARMDGASSAISVFQNRVLKRASPTYTASGSATVYYNSTSKACSGGDFAPSGGTVGGRVQWLSLSSGSTNTAAHVDTGSGCLLTASAEL